MHTYVRTYVHTYRHIIIHTYYNYIMYTCRSHTYYMYHWNVKTWFCVKYILCVDWYVLLYATCRLVISHIPCEMKQRQWMVNAKTALSCYLSCYFVLFLLSFLAVHCHLPRGLVDTCSRCKSSVSLSTHLDWHSPTVLMNILTHTRCKINDV